MDDSDVRDVDSEATRCRDESLVVARESDPLTLTSQELDGRKMERVESPDRHRKGLRRSCEDGRRHFEKADPRDELTEEVAM